jgi:hypothetical protein
MEIKVDVNAEQINQAVAEAIAKSVVGEKIKEFIEKSLKDMTSSYGNPIEPVVRNLVLESVRDYLVANYKPKLEELVKQRITDEMVAAFIDKVWQTYINSR